MSNKFILRKDWNIDTNFSGIKNKILIFQKGHEFSPDENSNYIIEWIGGRMVFDHQEMIESKDSEGDILFDLVNDNHLNINISEVKDEDDIKRWRIQLDVTTSLKKMKEIEKFINDNVSKIL